MTTPATPTAARTYSKDSSHWYYPDGRACYKVPKADGKGERATTLRDARKLGLVPSVTTILKILHKEALVQWQIEQAVLTVVTAPRQPNEADDAFIKRVLHEEEQQHEESQAARDLGTRIHDELEVCLVGGQPSAELHPWIWPAAEAMAAFGKVITTEQNLVGNGYAGKSDLIQDGGEFWVMTDYKSTKKLPDPAKGAWPEHRLQLAAYAAAWNRQCRREGKPERPIIRRNVYVSTINQGQYVICEHEEEWQDTYRNGFLPLVQHWQWATGHVVMAPVVAEEPNPQDAMAETILNALNNASDEVKAKIKSHITGVPAPTVGKTGRKVVVTEGVRVVPTAPIIAP
jgi:hypothetical protein